MASSIVAVLNNIKDQPLQTLSPQQIEAACDELGYCWRDGPLAPASTIALFIRQIAEGNVSCADTRHCRDAVVGFSASAYCQARQRLPLELFTRLCRGVCDRLRDQSDCRWRGHRTFHVDGSSFSMSDTPELQEEFGQPKGQKSGCGFPVAHLLVMFDALNGLILDAIASPLYTHEMSQVSKTHEQLAAGDLLIGDTSFGTYAHFALLLQAKMHGLFPAHQKRIIDFTPGRPYVSPSAKDPVKGTVRSRWIKSLGPEDQLVEWFKPPQRPKWMSQQQYDDLPESITVREVRRTIHRKGFRPLVLTMVTTLLDAEQYPAEELFELRRRRWDVETNLRHLKTTMNMEVLRCKSVQGVKKELAVFCLVYNLVRAVMLQASKQQGVPLWRISFADALSWLRQAKEGEELPNLLIHPQRLPDRLEPRALKRRPKEYDRLNKPREQMRNALREKAVAT